MKKKGNPRLLIIALSAVFLLIAGIGLFYGARYINSNLLQSGQSTATDIALLVKNNFQITDEEVAYMRTLTFNEMEVDPINRRLMDVGNGVVLNAAVTNVYLVAPLQPNEYRYCTDEETAAFLGFSMDTPLNGVWLLNGKINNEGVFEVAQREDIYRYTALDADQRRGMELRQPFGTFTTDAWGSFITGYAPIYTVEGNFVGLLGIDMDPDPYQGSAQRMILLIILLFALTVLMLCALFIVFYIKYTNAREGQRRFEFYSEVSHEMRTPMNGILGMAALSENEDDVKVLHQNLNKIESSGKYLLELINKTLSYRGASDSPPTPPMPAASAPAKERSYHELRGKRLLLCEDHPLNAEITRKMVEHVGCSLDVAKDGQLGVEMFSASNVGHYDAVLMDIRMPNMDGLEATRTIRQLARRDAKRVPIIALTANSYEEDIKATRDAGMNAHLTKPVDLRVLYQTLSDAICAKQKSAGKRRL